MSFSYNDLNISGKLGVGKTDTKYPIDCIGISSNGLMDVNPATIGLTGISTLGVESYSVSSSRNGKFIYYAGKDSAGNTKISKSFDYGYTAVNPFGSFPGSSGAYTNVSCNDSGDTVLAFSGNTIQKQVGSGSFVASAPLTVGTINQVKISGNATQSAGHAYAITSSTIYKSIDSGATWADLGLAGNWASIDVSPSGQTFVVAGTSGVFSSVDSGASIQACAVPAGKNFVSVCLSYNEQVVYALENTTEFLYKSSTGVQGVYTQVVTNPMDTTIAYSAEAVSCCHDGAHVITVSAPGIQFSYDGGNTWASNGASVLNDTIAVHCVKSCSAMYIGAPNGVFYQLLLHGVNHNASLSIFGGNVEIRAAQPSTSPSTGSFVMRSINGGMGSVCDLNATSSSQGGAMTIGGGAAFGKKVYAGQNMYTNGVYVVPSFFHYANDTLNTGTSSTTAVNRLSLTTASVPAGVYVYTVSGIATSSGTSNFVIQVTVDGVLSTNKITNSISPVGNGETFSFTNVLNFANAGTHTISLQMYSSTSSRTVSINTPTIQFNSVA